MREHSMCLAIPGQIVALLPERPDLATVEVSGVRRNVNIEILESEAVKPGDWVLIHVGFAISKINEEEARASLAFLEELGQAYTDELKAIKESWLE
jgi:hydrogenase expression/formation protein HypC